MPEEKTFFTLSHGLDIWLKKVYTIINEVIDDQAELLK